MKQVSLMLLTVLLLAGVAHACPMCKDTIANSSGMTPGGTGSAAWGGGAAGAGASTLSAGFNLSVYTMFAGLFGCLGLIGRTIYMGVKNTPR